MMRAASSSTTMLCNWSRWNPFYARTSLLSVSRNMRKFQSNTVLTRQHVTSFPPGQPASLRPFPEQTSAFHLLLKPALFTVGISATAFGVAIAIEYETRHPVRQHGALDYLDCYVNNDEEESNNKELSSFCWPKLDPHMKTMGCILGVNTMLCGMWAQLGPGSLFMGRWFSHNPRFSVLFSPILLNQFSHSSPAHMLFNMAGLYLVSKPILETMGAPEFVALFLSGGVAASMASTIHQVVTGSYFAGIGASGAVMAVLGATATLAPESYPFGSLFHDARTTMAILLLVDCVGLVRGRSFLFKSATVAYANHIGGALFGLAYGAYGKQLVDEARPSFLSHYIGLKHRVMGVDEDEPS